MKVVAGAYFGGKICDEEKKFYGLRQQTYIASEIHRDIKHVKVNNSFGV
jgi:hypothetical protein